jgi:phage terminase small subunit
MKNSKGLNPRQRKFCILRASGMGQFEAYKKAGFKGKRCDASKLEANSNINQQIQTLQDKTENKAFDLVAECQHLAPEAINTIKAIMNSPEPAGYRLNAAQQLLDRGYGKATEHIDVKGKIIIDLTRDNG